MKKTFKKLTVDDIVIIAVILGFFMLMYIFRNL